MLRYEQFFDFYIDDLSLRMVFGILVILELPKYLPQFLIPGCVARFFIVLESFVFVLTRILAFFRSPAKICHVPCTLSRLFSRCSSRQSFSSFSFSVIDLLSSVLEWSFSFCSISPRFLFFRFSRSRRFMSARCSVTRFCKVSIFCRSSILEVRLFNSRLAFLTSRSVTMLGEYLCICSISSLNRM